VPSAGKRSDGLKNTLLAVAGLIVVVGGAVRWVAQGCASLNETRQKSLAMDRSKEHLIQVVGRLREEAKQSGWGGYGGRAFVLSLILSKRLDPAKDAGLLFSGGDAHQVAAASAYAGLTAESLHTKQGRETLTSYVGRRNDEPAFRLTAEDLERHVPIVADLQFDDYAIVGFSDGKVETMSTRAAELGFKGTIERPWPPEGKPVPGDDSVFPILVPLAP